MCAGADECVARWINECEGGCRWARYLDGAEKVVVGLHHVSEGRSEAFHQPVGVDLWLWFRR